ncbi:MAG: GtrA family protein [Candidatus Margulisbacteria bacterium]|nr:GtrA family protein [Candidatus Margulisiibacteriota bacterium]
MIRRIYHHHRQKIDYLLVGLWNTIFGYLAFVAFYYLLGHRVHYLWLLILSNILSITNAYVGYKLFVFKTKGNYLQEYARFYIVYGLAFLLNFALLPVGVEFFRFSPVIAQAALTFINVAFSYLGHKNFSFKSGFSLI